MNARAPRNKKAGRSSHRFPHSGSPSVPPATPQSLNTLESDMSLVEFDLTDLATLQPPRGYGRD